MNTDAEEGGAHSTPHKVKVFSPYLSDSAGTGTSQGNEEQQVRTSIITKILNTRAKGRHLFYSTVEALPATTLISDQLWLRPPL